MMFGPRHYARFLRWQLSAAVHRLGARSSGVLMLSMMLLDLERSAQ